ncbi:hypothetical protein [Leptotrichia sp. oral taxon 223]|uniref:hypothetical protein n=1 Tax=Leptotrichia sp. oral taxon 223 TaxID=712363 RepID=UPI0015C0ED1D|nr:hypothetical protein [Leptotrichia sp. oral taxon 223]NWO20231.1 hypothetical protein [Leptotrichia sp. oral taxon 223]
MAEESKELAKIQNNWYEILELEYYPVPEENEKRIEARIEEKKRHWLAKESDPFDGKKYKKYNNLAKSGIIREEMLNEARRKELIKDAQQRLFKPIDDFLKYLNGVAITEEIVTEIAKKTRRKENLVRERIEKIERKIEPKEYDEKIYQKFLKYVHIKFNEFYEFSAFGKYLEILSKDNLYDFLISEGLDIKTLTQKEIDDNRKKLIKFDNETSAKKKLFSACELILKHKDKIKKYDDYLEHLKYLKVHKELEKIEQVYNLTKNKVPVDKFTGEIEKIVKNKNEAQSLVIGFCKENKIPYMAENNLILPDKNDNPERAAKQNRYAEKSEDLCIEALRAIKKSKFAEAQKYLNDAKLYWAENSSITVLQEKLDEVRRERRQENKDNNTVKQAKKNSRNAKRNEAGTYVQNNSKNSINAIFLIISGILICILVYLAATSLSSSETQQNQENAVSNNGNVVSTEGEEKTISLNPSANFSVTTNNLYYSGKTDTYLGQTAVTGNSSIGNYTSLVIQKFPRKRYDMLLENGVKDRVFKFKCGVKLKAKGTTLFVQNAEDVVSFKNKNSADEDVHIKENKGCFTDFTKINENK